MNKLVVLDANKNGPNMDEQLQLPIDCDKVVKREIYISNCRETNTKDCHRTFNIYFPRIICEARDVLDQIGTLPLVFVVHCYGCNSQMIMQSFNPYANTHNLVIVAPDGLHGSFNGLDCCGYALGSKIDDIGFFSQIQATLEEDYPFVKSIYSYAVGWSNGGFMIMYSSQLFRAISPISGYVIDYSKMIGGTSVFFHHSLNDPFVRSTGCCNDPKMPTCCCGIFAERCVSVQDVMKDIAQKKNGCNYEAGAVQLEQSFEDTQKGISCLTSVGKSCIANNTICMYNHSGHFNGGSFATSFPMSEQVMDFFANEACAVNNGLWDNKNKACTCQDELIGGVFCLDSAGSDVIKTLDSDEEDTLLPEKRSSIEEPNHVFTGGILILTVAVFVWFRHQINRRQKEKIDNNASGEKIELVSSGLMRFGDI